MTDFKIAQDVPIAKIDEEKQLVFGWASVPVPIAKRSVEKVAAGSEEAKLNEINTSFREQAFSTDEYYDSYIYATFEDYVIVERWNRGVTYWRVDFTTDGDTYTFDFAGATEVALTFVVKSIEDQNSRIAKELKTKVDLQGDTIFMNDLEDAAYDFVLNSRLGDADHERIAATMVESFVATEEKYLSMGLTEDVIKTLNLGWWIGFRVDDDAWEGVKKGTYKMFSIFGTAKTEEIDV